MFDSFFDGYNRSMRTVDAAGRALGRRALTYVVAGVLWAAAIALVVWLVLG